MNSQKIIHDDFCIKENKKLSEDFYLLNFETPETVYIQPGNFLMLSFPERKDLFLPRPFSIFDVVSNSVSILYKIVGKGTKYLSTLASGAKISCTLPLGNSFEKPAQGDYVFLVGGGFGVAPLNFYHRKHENLVENIKFLVGAQTKNQLPFSDLILKNNKYKQNILFATDDGTLGFKGFVTDLLQQELNALIENSKQVSIKIKACGPTLMLKAIKNVVVDFQAKPQAIFSMEFSLEERMACGIGVCNGCVVNTVTGYKRVCKEGPVFNADEIIFT